MPFLTFSGLLSINALALFCFWMSFVGNTEAHLKYYRLSGPCKLFADGSKSIFFLKIVNFEGLQMGHQQTLDDGIRILFKVENPPLKKVRLIFFFLEKNAKSSFFSFLYSPQRTYLVNTFVTSRNNDLGSYVSWRHLISAKF